jgi:hypothetical protein
MKIESMRAIMDERELIAKYLSMIAEDHRTQASEIRTCIKHDSTEIGFDSWHAHMHEMQAGELDHIAFKILFGRYLGSGE